MSLSIFLANEKAQLRSRRYPLKVTWRFTCDGFHGFTDPPTRDFFSDEEFAYAKAMRRGWKETYSKKGIRQFLCPQCSRK